MDYILTYNNCLFVFVHNQINEKLPNTFAEIFLIASNQDSYITRVSKFKTIKTINNSTYSTISIFNNISITIFLNFTCGLNSNKHRVDSDWNEVTKDISYISFNHKLKQ